MKKLHQQFKSEMKNIPAAEFPSYIRERALNEESSIYCILEVSKERDLFPYFKFGDWEYYWFSYNWKFLDNPKEDKNFKSLPCLLVLNPRKLSVRSFIEQRMGKGLFIIFESSALREQFIESCPQFLEAGTGENENNFQTMEHENLITLLKDSPYKQKRNLFKFISSIWIERDNETVLEFCKTQDEEYIRESVEDPKQVKKEVSLLGAMMDSIAEAGSQHKAGDTFSTKGWMVG